ncbi:MAG: AAA family ATPase [Desulfobacterales bacterium]|nr:AAA family ATPase [Desulfobacterales bacterium]MBU8910119.1 AAA family ATPase [Desulfobacterales bacterium]
MLKKDLISKSPVSKTIGIEKIKDGRFGAVLSRAGVGKTSFLVQIALTRLLNNEKILHVSLDDPMGKINLRYHEGYTSLIDYIGYVDPQKAVRLWENIKPNKVGISYNEVTFDTEKIKDYLKSFKKADLTLPSIIIIDGLNFDKDVSTVLGKLENLSKEFSVVIWFSMKIHREEGLCETGFPIQLETYKDRFDKAVFLQPVENKIEAIILKDGDRTDQRFMLNPSTMMIVGE